MPTADCGWSSFVMASRRIKKKRQQTQREEQNIGPCNAEPASGTGCSKATLQKPMEHANKEEPTEKCISRFRKWRNGSLRRVCCSSHRLCRGGGGRATIHLTPARTWSSWCRPTWSDSSSSRSSSSGRTGPARIPTSKKRRSDRLRWEPNEDIKKHDSPSIPNTRPLVGLASLGKTR